MSYMSQMLISMDPVIFHSVIPVKTARSIDWSIYNMCDMCVNSDSFDMGHGTWDMGVSNISIYDTYDNHDNNDSYGIICGYMYYAYLSVWERRATQ